MSHGKLVAEDIRHHLTALILIEEYDGAFEHVKEKEGRDRQVACSM